MKNGSNFEIERKFLIKQLPDDFNYKDYKRLEIAQGYLEPKKFGNIRLRKWGENYSKTEKRGEGVERFEKEQELDKKQFEKLWKDVLWSIKKFRYLIPYEKFYIELDVYKGGLEGLMVAEVEFMSLKQSESFNVPCWFGKELTGEPSFSNYRLARYGLNQKALL